MKDKKIILIIHSNENECTKIGDKLSKHGYEIMCMVSQNQNAQVDLVICFEHEGVSIKRLRKSFSAPIIFVSAEKDESFIVKALDAGASDYFVLPFGRFEHLARIRVLLRDFSLANKQNDIFQVGELFINFPARKVRVSGENIHLTPIEFRIITLLAKNAGNVLTHEQLINEIWGPYNSDNLVIRVNMANIRRKLEPVPSEPRYILTDTGVGYRMALD